MLAYQDSPAEPASAHRAVEPARAAAPRKIALIRPRSDTALWFAPWLKSTRHGPGRAFSACDLPGVGPERLGSGVGGRAAVDGRLARVEEVDREGPGPLPSGLGHQAHAEVLFEERPALNLTGTHRLDSGLNLATSDSGGG